MKAANPPFPPLDHGGAEPLYRQIYARIKAAIADGLLRPGARVPAARALALELGLARGTVEAAYALLAAEGYVEPRGQAGTVVASALARPLPSLPSSHSSSSSLPSPSSSSVPPSSSVPYPAVLSSPSSPPMSGTGSAGGLAGSPSPHDRPFQMGLPALDAFPRKVWAALAARAVRATQAPDMAYPAYRGEARLRAAIATYLRLARGIACAPSQVFITAGYRNSLELVARALLRPGDGVWVEDPGYPPTSALLRAAGLVPAPVPVDAEGLMVARGVAGAPRARAAIVTPAHQSPLGVSLSLPRRLALLDWAARAGAWVVEDDYDGEYRYVGRPLPALKSLDREDRVLYAGTFSKVLFPALRLAYLVVPAAQVARFEQICETCSAGGPALTQAIVAAFMDEGHFARHIQRMRRLYAERRRHAAEAFTRVLGRHLRVDAQPGGMHLVLRLHGDGHTDRAGRREPPDRALAERMRRDGMFALALSECAVAPAATEAHEPGKAGETGEANDGANDSAGALMLAFTNIDTPAKAEALAHRILALIG